MLPKYASSVVAAMFFAGSASAQLITVQYEGQLSGAAGEFASVFSAGDSFSGSYSVALGSEDGAPSGVDSNWGRYVLTEYSLVIDGHAFTGTGGFLDVFNGLGLFSQTDLHRANGVMQSSAFEIFWDFTLEDSTGLSLTSDDLTEPPVSLLNSARWFDFQSTNGDGFASGSISNITVVTSPIPEPETYAMLLAGFALLGFEARRRKKTRSPAA